MFYPFIACLSRLLPQEDPREAAHPWFNPDSNWHGSSFELASGLEVIELGVPPAAWAEVQPAS